MMEVKEKRGSVYEKANGKERVMEGKVNVKRKHVFILRCVWPRMIYELVKGNVHTNILLI